MKKLLAVVTALMLLCGTALALSAREVAGLWKSVTMTAVSDGTRYDAVGDLEIELNADGTFCFPSEESGEVYTWEIDGEQIRLYNPDGSLSGVTITLEGDTLVLDDGEYRFEMKKDEA